MGLEGGERRRRRGEERRGEKRREERRREEQRGEERRRAELPEKAIHKYLWGDLEQGGSSWEERHPYLWEETRADIHMESAYLLRA